DLHLPATRHTRTLQSQADALYPAEKAAEVHGSPPALEAVERGLGAYVPAVVAAVAGMTVLGHPATGLDHARPLNDRAHQQTHQPTWEGSGVAKSIVCRGTGDAPPPSHVGRQVRHGLGELPRHSHTLTPRLTRCNRLLKTSHAMG